MSTDVVIALAAVMAGVGVAFLMHIARRKATWPWRALGAVAGLAGVTALLVYVIRDGGSIMPLVVFTVLAVASNVFALRERRSPHALT